MVLVSLNYMKKHNYRLFITESSTDIYAVSAFIPYRLYQAANLSLNMFILDSSFLFSYAWCIGVDTVTTNNCKKLSDFKHNTLYQVAKQEDFTQYIAYI